MFVGTDTAKADAYKPQYLEHYERQEEAKQAKISSPVTPPINPSNAPTVPSNAPMHIAPGNHRVSAPPPANQEAPPPKPPLFLHRPFSEMDFDFVSFSSLHSSHFYFVDFIFSIMISFHIS